MTPRERAELAVSRWEAGNGFEDLSAQSRNDLVSLIEMAQLEAVSAAAHLEHLDELARMAVRLAWQEAIRLEMPRVDVGRLLLGLARMNYGAATNILAGAGLGVREIRRALEVLDAAAAKEAHGEPG